MPSGQLQYLVIGFGSKFDNAPEYSYTVEIPNLFVLLEEEDWIVRLNPYLLIRVEQPGLRGFRLHCWPPVARGAMADDELMVTLTEMVEWARDSEGLPEIPDTWEFVFDEKMRGPTYVALCDNDTQFMAVLRAPDGRFWSVSENGRDVIDAPVEVQNYWNLWRKRIGQRRR